MVTIWLGFIAFELLAILITLVFIIRLLAGPPRGGR